jgi:hypothetical protein
VQALVWMAEWYAGHRATELVLVTSILVATPEPEGLLRSDLLYGPLNAALHQAFELLDYKSLSVPIGALRSITC